MIERIEELAAELKVRLFGGSELLEQREVQVVVAGTMSLRRESSQRCGIALSHRRSYWRSRKGCRVEELGGSVRADIRIDIFSLHHVRPAPIIGGRGLSAADGEREAILECVNPLSAPAADNGVRPTGHTASQR